MKKMKKAEKKIKLMEKIEAVKVVIYFYFLAIYGLILWVQYKSFLSSSTIEKIIGIFLVYKIITKILKLEFLKK
jgi:cell division septal protein FtsQ